MKVFIKISLAVLLFFFLMVLPAIALLVVSFYTLATAPVIFGITLVSAAAVMFITKSLFISSLIAFLVTIIALQMTKGVLNVKATQDATCRTDYAASR